MTEPVLVGELLPGVLQEVIDRAGPGYDRWAEQVAATGYCAHPVRLRGRVDHADPRDRRGPHGLLDRPGAGRHPPQGLRQPAGLGLPVLLGHLPGRQLPPPRRWPAGRQGRPRDGGRPSAAVRDLHRAVLRPGPLPQGARAAGLPLPPLPAGPAVPAWPAGGLLAAPRRRRSPAGGAAVRPLLPGRRPSAVERPGRPAVVADHHLPVPGAGPARRRDRGGAAAAGADLVRQGGRVPEAGRGPLPRHHPPGRRHRLRLPRLRGPAAGRVHRRPPRASRPAGRRHRGRALPDGRRGPGRDPDRPLG